jgi:hypothetical protein
MLNIFQNIFCFVFAMRFMVPIRIYMFEHY